MTALAESSDRVVELARRVMGAPLALVSAGTLPSAEPLIIADTRSEFSPADDLVPTDLPVLAYLGVPLVAADGEMFGSFCVIDHQPRSWTDSDVATMIDLAAMVRSEIELREALRDRDRYARRLHATSERRAQLFRYAEALTGATDIDDIVAIVLDLGAEVLGASYASVGSVDQTANELVVASNRTAERVRRLLDDSSPLSRAVRTRAPVASTSAGDRAALSVDGWTPGPTDRFDSVLAHPLIGHRGGLCFAWNQPVEVDDDLLEVVRSMSELTGQAMERAVRFERERRIADSLQRSLLPGRLITVPDTDLASRYEAGVDGMHAGGDWYDVAPLGESRYVLVVGDVVGRGLRAAATMGQLRQAFSALATASDDFGSLLDHIDAAASEIDNAAMSTVVAVEWSPETRRIRCISAGHLPPMIRRQDGRVEQLPDAGPPIGLFTDVEREPFETVMADGDAILLYTDGLVERRGESLDEGLARLRDVLAGLEIASAQSLCDETFELLDVEQHDDVALLAMVVGGDRD